MAAKFDAKYVQGHMAAIHTNDSWSRAISEQVLRQVISKIGEGSTETVTVDAKFHVSAVEAKGCIQVCGEINGVIICTHINV